jgi:hypothetical protein
MSTAVKKSVALSPALSNELAQIAREEGKTVSAVIQDALRESKRKRLTQSVLAIIDYISTFAIPGRNGGGCLSSIPSCGHTPRRRT